MNTIADFPRRLGPKRLLALMAAVVVLSMAGALYFQHVLHLEPCPLCVIQRVAIVAVGLVALAGALATGARGQWLAAVLAGLMAVAGAGVAAWHSWILVFPPESMSCGRPFEWFHEDFPLATWLPKLFAGEGDCLKMDWTFLGLAIPHLALIAFVLLLAGALLAAREAGRRTRAGAI
jgi:disulfide bond formation protein DsbB